MMGNFRVELRYLWGVFNLYINMKSLLLQTLVICLFIFIMALAFRDSFMFFAIPMWVLFLVIALCLKWQTTIKPERAIIMKQLELEEKYPFLYARFSEHNEIKK